MKRVVEITYSNSAKIPKAAYEQESPLYAAKSVIDCANGDLVDERGEFLRLKSLVDPLLAAHIHTAKNDLSRFHIREINGKKSVSVTSILQPDPIDMDPQLLEWYARRGRVIEDDSVHFIQTGEWREPQGDIGKLAWTDIKYREWFEKFGKHFTWENAQFQAEIVNDRFKFYGKVDALTVSGGHPTILDFKTGRWSWPQLVAYAHGDMITPSYQVAVADFKKCKLETLTRDDPAWQTAWEEFLIKRGEFAGRFGL